MASHVAKGSSPRACQNAAELASMVSTLIEALVSDRAAATPTSWRDEDKSDLSVGLTVWRAAAASISKSATKLALVYADGAPTAAEAASICTEAFAECEQLATARYVLAASGSGAPLRELVDAATRHVLIAMRALGAALRDGSKGNAEAGVVWEACDTADKAPKSNRVAYRRKFLTWSSELKDSLDEFNQLLDDDGDAFSFEDDDDPTVGCETSYASATDEAAARQCLGLLEAVGMTYRRVLLVLDERGKGRDFAGIARLYAFVRDLARAATATAEELYPPLDKADLIGRVDALSAAFAALAATAHLATPDRDLPRLWNRRLVATKDAIAGLRDDDLQ